MEKDLTDTEKRAVSRLLKRSSTQDNSRTSDTYSSITERMATKCRVCTKKENHINCNFIVGSVAKVERLWSIGKLVCTSSRRRMTPQLFEALLFLRENERFWNERLVAEAIGCAKSKRVRDKLDAHTDLSNDQ